MTPFASAATEYRNAGLAVIPCNGKIPAVKWETMKRRPSQVAIQKWADRRPGANIGAITGLSDITVVDVDHPEFLDSAIDEFGETPAIAKTGKGFHLFYHHTGEKTLTGFHPGVDVRGAGGFVVLPPSIHPDSRKQYAWAEGGVDDLAHLPKVKPSSLPLVGDTFASDGVTGSYDHERNDTLFREALRIGLGCASHADLEQLLLGINATMFREAAEGPLPESEVKATAQSVWGYRERGELFPPGQVYARLRGHEIDQLMESPNALALLAWLRKAHLGRDETFPISPTGLGPVIGWRWEKVSKARNALLEAGLIELRSEAKRRKGIAALYAFPDLLITHSVTYINNIPPPWETGSRPRGINGRIA